MGLLSRLRARIAGVFGSDDTGEPPPGKDAGDESDADADPTGLDPSAATEIRAAATDDAVEALRDVRRSQEVSPADERAPNDSEDADSDGR